MHDKIVTATRRQLFGMLATGAGLAALGLPGRARAQGRQDVLVIGADISDNVTNDPATAASGPYSPAVIKMSYDQLITMSPGDYIGIKPALATAWEKTPDGQGWRFTLRDGVKFNSGNPVTVDDVKWSFDRVINIKAQPSIYIPNVAEVKIVDDRRVDIVLHDPRRPTLDILTDYAFIVYERKVLEAHGGDASPASKEKDKATKWLDQNSCGTGPYTLTSWQRGTGVFYDRNPHYWGGLPPFRRVVVRHISDPAAQLLAVQRGDIDIAFNLIPEQVDELKGSKTVRIDRLESLDMVYVALTCNPDFNKALAVREARQAVLWAIDYDGIIKNLLHGQAQRPASLLPIGLLGSTPEVAQEVGPRQDLAKAKEFLAKAGFPDGFSFRMTYGNASYAAVSYGVLAQKMQADLARIGIKMELDPQDPLPARTEYNAGRCVATVTAWPPSSIDSWVWASATVERIAKRMHWAVPPDIAKLVDDANTELDLEKQKQFWVQYQKRMVEEAYLWPLFQQNYQIAVSRRLKPFPFTAVGWYFDAQDIRPVTS